MRGLHYLTGLMIVVLAVSCRDSSTGGGGGGSTNPAPSTPVSLSVDFDLTSLETLLSDLGLTATLTAETIQIQTLAGALVVELPASLPSVEVESERAYRIRLTLSDGRTLWALTPLLTADSTITVNLETLEETALIYATLGGAVFDSDDVEEKLALAGDALDNPGRFVFTVRRIVEYAQALGLEIDLEASFTESQLRAFGGGLDPERPLDEIASDPKSELQPYVYATRTLNVALPPSIIVAELEAARWDHRMRGAGTIERGVHAVHGGSLVVFESNRESGPDFNNDDPTVSTIYTLSIRSAADTEPTPVRTAALSGLSCYDPALSPDESQIAFAAGPNGESGPLSLYVMNLDGTDVTQITDEMGAVRNRRPRWSPDATQIVFESDLEGQFEIYTVDSSGENRTRLTDDPSFDGEPIFSPDGERVIFVSDRAGDREIFALTLDDPSVVDQLTENAFDDHSPSLALNGFDVLVAQGEAGILTGLSLLTGEMLYDFGNFAGATAYLRPVIAASSTSMVPSDDLVTQGLTNSQGYALDSAMFLPTFGKYPEPMTVYQLLESPESATDFTSAGIFSAWPDYVLPPREW